MPSTALPTLSEVRAFTGDYLTSAARFWSGSATQWIDTVDGLTRDVSRPAGTEWLGEAAEAAALRVGTDRRNVVPAADGLAAAAATARRAADDLHAAKAKLLSTVRAAEAAGFTIGEDFSLTSLESTTSSKALAAREALARAFGAAIRSDVLALVEADDRAAAQIAVAATGLRSLKFDGDDRTASDRAAIQTVDFHGAPFPEKPPKPPAIPPPDGWSGDPIMRAAQRIAYGHAWDEHRADFPGMTQAQLAELIHRKMQRSMTNPSGLTLGVSKSDGVPVIYDPRDNVLIVRDTRPNATEGGTVFKPDLAEDPEFVSKKFGWYESIFTPDQLADGSVSPTPTAAAQPELRQGAVGSPSDFNRGSVGTALPESAGGGGGGSWGDEIPAESALPDWGTHISPEEAAKHDGELGNLGKILLGLLPPASNGPDNTA